ncbi:porin [Erythrobacter dokdonensis]|uniref:Porin_4 domain-containing protein n=1 Tax=Erythrobacter dokdonensis DSW-74 TaxID=1300349 RepID=A0A1A7BI26_9SPHN|nr:porin [Erythrobacter dokdonensis]OBV11092.1 Porin_4 domain-containing protein [Erythrobacter dokdonensis DSW-74]
MRGGYWLRCAAGALALAGLGSPALAQGTATQQLLQRLYEKGILTEEEYAALMAETQAAPAAAAPAPAAPPEGSERFVKMTEKGIGLEVGPATIKFSGSVNAFYVNENPDTPGATTAVAGGIASVGDDSSNAVRNGLLPGYLLIDVTTQQAGLDIGAHFGMYPGINSANWGPLGANNGGQPTALATAGIDFRQVYITIGGGFGTVKMGRDIGLFGSEAILNDITLLAVGPSGGNVAPANTSLGRIGSGYIYTDFQPQITYTSPNLGGFQASVGVFQPLQSLTAPAQTNTEPGFQGKLTYDASLGDVGLRLWASGVTQRHDTIGQGTGGLVSYTGRGMDLGGKVTVGPFTGVANWYKAKGLGTTVLNLLDTDALGNPRSSDGFYVQGLATFGKFSIGASYGESNLDLTRNETAIGNTLVKTNSSYIGQLRYSLTDWVTLLAEYTKAQSEAHNGNEADSNSIAAGAILFF